MTVVTSTNRTSSAGNGVTTAFPFPNKFFLNSDLVVIKISSAGALTTQTETTHYTISGAGDPLGGTVTMLTPPAVGETLVIVRVVPFTQTTDHVNNDDSDAEVAENALDKLTMEVQQLNESFGRTFRTPLGDPGVAELGDAATRANKVLAFDSTGQPIFSILASGSAASLTSDLANTSDAAKGDALIGVKRTEAGAVATTQHVVNQKRPLHIETDFGALGDGTTLDDSAFTAAAAVGRVIHLRDGATYYLSSRVSGITGSRFICPDGISTIKFKTGAGGYNGTDLTVSKTGAGVCGFLFDTVDDVGMEGIRFITDAVAERLIYPVRVSGGTATKGCRFERLEFVGFAVCNGALLSLNTIGVGSYVVRDIVARSCGTALTTWTGTPQITIVELDNDMVASTPSAPGYMENIRGYDIALTGAALTTYGQQTDILNLAGVSGTDRKGPTIYGVYGDNVGEVVDAFCQHAIIKGIRGRQCYNYCLKLIHGAKHNDIEVEAVENFGQAAVTFSGSASVAAHTQYNRVRVGVVRKTAAIGSFTQRAAVLFQDNGGDASSCLPKNNEVDVGLVIGDSSTLDYVVRDGAADNNNANRVRVGFATGWVTAAVSCVPDNERVCYGGRGFAHVTMSADQTGIVSGVETKLTYNTVAAGNDPEVLVTTGTNTITFKWPGLYKIKAQVRCVGWGVGTEIQLRIKRDTTAVLGMQLTHQSATKGETPFAEGIIQVKEDELGTVNANYTVHILHDAGSDKIVTSTADMTYFQIGRCEDA